MYMVGWLIDILIIGFVIYFFLEYKTNKHYQHYKKVNPEESTLEILKRRYARGEITDMEFEKIKNKLKDDLWKKDIVS
ncbi:MAG: SHOCT domain-containing protein [Candidatus Jettenia sp. CY-1]|nr:SHOCT domain-containing protein [Candidatus Jettenia sp.]WKZ19828.1 MAG: SHOCT domain-containing protein [Candidatus Jettenia sp. CY-1]